MTILDRIKSILQNKRMTLAELERISGLGNRTLYKWDRSYPSIDKVITVANTLQVSVEWLITGKENILIDDESKAFLEKYKKLSPYEKKKISAFIEISLISMHKEDTDSSSKTIEEKPEIYHSNVTKYNFRSYKPTSEPNDADDIPYIGSVAAGSPNLYYYDSPEYVAAPVACDFAMTANGDSMYPVIHDEDYIFVKSTPFLENGDIGIISLNGETTCKKFYLHKNHITLKSFNPDYEPMHYTIDEYSNIHIMGKVVLTDEQKERLANLGMV